MSRSKFNRRRPNAAPARRRRPRTDAAKKLIAAAEFDPLRPTDWRRDMARRYFNRGEGWFRRSGDRYLLQAYRLVAVIRRCELLPGEKIPPAPTLVTIAASHLYDEGERHAELEARLLAGQSIPEVAAILDIPEPVIEAYERIYFDVRPRLKAKDYIRHHAINPLSLRPDHPTYFDVLVRKFAYWGGRLVLDVVLDALDEGLAEADLATVPNLGRIEEQSRLAAKRAILSELLPLDRISPQELGILQLLCQPLTLENDKLAEVNKSLSDNLRKLRRRPGARVA